MIALPLALLAAAAVYFVSLRLPPTYESSAVVLATKESNTSGAISESTSLSAPPIEAEAYNAIVLTRPVLNDAISRLGTSELTPDDLIDVISVSVDGDRQALSNLVEVSVQADSPQAAARRTNAVAEALIEWDYLRASQNLGQRIETLEEQVSSLDESIESLRLMGQVASPTEIESRVRLRSQQQEELSYARALLDSASGLLSLVEPAVPVPEPVAPRPLFNAALAAIVTAFLVYGVALLRSAVDTRLRDIEAVSQVTNLPVLAEFPNANSKNAPLFREAADYLQARLMLATSSANPRVILITSPRAEEGKTTVSLHLAESLARHGHRTLLVDADLRQPSIAQRYGVPAGQDSLLDYLKRPEGRTPTTLEVEGRVFDLIPGVQGPRPALLGQNLAACLDLWKRQYDVIVIDSAPLLPVADTFAIAPLCTHTVMIANLRRSDRRSTQTATERLSAMAVPLVGIVVTQVKQRLKRSDYRRYLRAETN